MKLLGYIAVVITFLGLFLYFQPSSQDGDNIGAPTKLPSQKQVSDFIAFQNEYLATYGEYLQLRTDGTEVVGKDGVVHANIPPNKKIDGMQVNVVEGVNGWEWLAYIEYPELYYYGHYSATGTYSFYTVDKPTATST